MPAPGFTCVVCGVDGTREGFEAARQAACLTASGGRLVLVAVADFFAAVAGRWGPERAHRRTWDSLSRSAEESLAGLRQRAQASLDLAGSQAAGTAEIATRVVDGDVDVQLLEVAEAEGATLLVVGTHGGRRLSGAAIGEVTSMVLHEAPMSVLVARPPFDPQRFPATIVAGIDGSLEARWALDVAAALRRRSGGRLTVLAAGRSAETGAPLEGFDAPHELVVASGRPVEELVDAARTADLLVVGSRGLHGARTLGSVSERVAHRAPSSVLVARSPLPVGGAET